jgi:hypothetical protein
MLFFDLLQEPSLYTGSSVMDRHPDQQQCCMAVAFKGAAWTDPDSVPLMVMQTMLGGWDRNNTSGKHAGEIQQTLAAALQDMAMCLLLVPCSSLVSRGIYTEQLLRSVNFLGCCTCCDARPFCKK